MTTIQHLNAYLKQENAKWPWHLVEIPREQWPKTPEGKDPKLSVWRSRDFLAQVYQTPTPGIVRLSVNRTQLSNGRWTDGITWDELHQLKHQAGYGDCDAVEVYPANDDVVNVANMRHLFIFTDSKLPYAWRKESSL